MHSAPDRRAVAPPDARFNCVFDIETDGFNATRVHCLVLADAATGELYSFADQPGYSPIELGLDILSLADCVIGHNILAFDLRIIKKLHGLEIAPERVLDTLTASRVLWPDLREEDAQRSEMPAGLVGKHSLEAWGWRLSQRKGSFGKTTDWRRWSKQMQQYCEDDVRTTLALFQSIMRHRA